MTIRELFENNCKDSDMVELYEVIRNKTKKCRNVVEFGVWEWKVTTAILAWLWRYGKLVGYDKVSKSAVAALKEVAKQERKYFSYLWWDSIVMDIPEADMLVIDTLHNANQLWAELYDSHKKIDKWIVICGTNKYSEIWEDEWHLWLKFAINKFVTDIGWWEIDKVSCEWYGFTILKKS